MTAHARTVLIVGGTSDIGRATALIYAEKGWHVLLTARSPDAGQREVDHISTATKIVPILHHLDILDAASFEPFVEALGILPDTVICAVGLLPAQSRAAVDIA